jgi:Flp pilus assembly protein TadD
LAYIANKKFDEAIADLKQAIKINPKSSEAYDGLGVAYTQTGKTDEALSSLNTALILNPNNTNALKNRVALFKKTGDSFNALADTLRLKRLGLTE